MALPRLTILLVLLALVPLTIFGVSTANIVTNNLNRVESSQVNEAVTNTGNVIADIEKSMSRMASDYSIWDDLHQRIVTNDQIDTQWFDMYYGKDSISSVVNIHHLNTIGIWNKDQRLVYGVGPLSEVMPPISSEIAKSINAGHPNTLLVGTPIGIYIVALTPVLTSNSADPNGVLLLARPLSQADTEQIKSLTGYNSAIYQGTTLIAANDDITGQVKTEKLQAASTGAKIVDNDDHGEWGIIYSSIRDNRNIPIGTLVIKHSRQVIVSTTNSIMLWLGGLLTLGIILAAVAVLYLRRLIVYPLQVMARSADRIANGDLTHPMEAPTSINEFQRVAYAYNRMAERLGERLTDAETARQKLEEVDEYRLKLLGEITEALQEPIQIIQTHSQLLEMEAHGNLNDAQRRSASAISQTIAVEQSLLADLIDFAQAQKKGLRLSIERLLLSDMVWDVYEHRIKARYAHKNIQFITEYPDDLPRVTGDSMRTCQVLERLLDWAFDLSSTNSRVTLITNVKDDLVEIRLSDNSSGLTDEQREDLFGLFHRRTKSNITKSNIKPFEKRFQQDKQMLILSRNELGLAFARTLIEQQGGTLAIESYKGIGNTFIVTMRTTSIKDVQRLTAAA